MNNFGMDNIGINNMSMDNAGMNNIGMNIIGMNNLGMNNFGINDNGLNNIGINNMQINPININNQSNLMHENVLRIKNIIQPYENKIKELEEIIRQKDFEIAVLKDKLNNNNINIQYPNLMNMNQMNAINQFPNQEFDKRGKKIIVSLMNFLNQILPKKLICYENDYAYKLFEQISEYHWELRKFSLNEKTIHPFLSIKENGIKDGSIIKLNFAHNIIFKHVNGTILNIAMDENYPIKKAIKFYLLRIGKEGCFREFTFIYNGIKLNFEDKTPIKIIFRGANDAIILVQ